MKAGIKSSEFWKVVITNIISVGVLSGIIQPDIGNEIGEVVVTSIVLIGTLLENLAYIRGRLDLKIKEQDKELTKTH